MVAVIAFSVLAQVVWAFIGTVVRLQTSIRTMQWALIGLWICPVCVAVLYLRLCRRSGRESLLVGVVFGLLTSGILYVLLVVSLSSMP